MGCITHKCKAWLDEFAGQCEAKRKGAARTLNRQRAKTMTETLLKFGLKDEIVFADQALGIGCAFRPDERAAIALEWQDGKWTCGQEVLIGTTTMRALMGDVADDARLVVIPVDRLDASNVAQARFCAVCGNQQAGDECFTIGQLHGNRFRIGFKILDAHAFDEGDAECICLSVKGGVEHTVFNHMGKRLARVHVAREG